MNNSEIPENRKDSRRNSIKKKKNFDKVDYNLESRDQNKLRKQFKQYKQNLAEDERWEEWENDLS